MPETNFPNKGDDKKISLSNSEFGRFDRAFAARIQKEHPKIWGAGGNTRGNGAWKLYQRALDGDDAAAVVDWIKEREAWAARHYKDGSQFPGASANVSNIGGVVAAMKWGVVLQIGEKTMKDTINEVVDKQDDERAETPEIENRDAYNCTGSTCEIRMSDDEPTIVGYAALYNSPTQIGSFREVIKPGAFDDVVDGDVRMLINHDPNQVVARTTSGTLKLSVDERGLKYEAKPGSQTYSRDLVESIQRGDISGSSFAFTVKPDGQEWNDDRTERSIFRVESLAEVSAVVFPAYEQSSVSVRSENTAEQENTADQQKNSNPKPKHSMSLETNEIRRRMSELNERTEALNNAIESDGRQAFAEEQRELDDISTEYDRLTEKLKRAEQVERQRAALAVSGGASKSDVREAREMNRRFSLSKAVMEAAHGNLSGVEAEWNQTAQNEARASGAVLEGNFAIPEMAFRADEAGVFGATAYDSPNVAGDQTATGSAFVPTNVGSFIEQLRPAPLVERMGATVLGGLTGDTVLPRANAFSAGVAAEGAALGLSGTVDNITLTPNRVGGQGIYTKRLLMQGGPDVDRMIASEMGRAITEQIDALCVEGTTPAGLNQTGQHTDVATAVIDSALATAEGAYIAAGGDPNAAVILMGPNAHTIARTQALVDNVAPLYDNASGMTIFGRPVFVSKHVTDTAADPEFYYMDPRALVLAFFGTGIDFIADVYSNAANSEVRLFAHRYFDTDVRHAALVQYCADTVA